MRKSDVVMILSERNKCIVDDASMIKGGTYVVSWKTALRKA